MYIIGVILKMGGLAGIISSEKNKKNRKKVDILLEKISHRGKKRKIYSVCGSYIGINTNYRLNNTVEGRVILLDGKIYNLDKLFLKYNIKDGGTKDNKLISGTEKINILFDIAGKNIFKEFRGSFVLILADSNGDIYIIRDVIGRKPLYYLKDREDLMFASEIKSLINSGTDIRELPPGSCMLNSDNPETIKKIDNGDFSLLEDEADKKLEEELKDQLLKSVDRRISGNYLKFGVWLSGGLDSSIIAALLKEFTDKVYTYSVGFENSPDLLSARKVADYLGTKHTEYRLDADELFFSIPRVIYCLESFDAPLVRSSLGNMIVSKISSDSDVVFSGEGGDELFAGYNYFLEFNSSKLIQQELIKSINSLHNTALQRVDRTANAYSVNTKLPILDDGLLDFVLRISPEMKVRKDKNTGKYILRKVASGYLPEDITWRAKDKFWEGSGIENTLERKIEDTITDKEFEKIRELPGNVKLRNKEEVYYYKIFKDCFSDIDFNNVIALTQDFNQA
jgi:asparagine synthase (glutamine-hydrolysing)